MSHKAVVEFIGKVIKDTTLQAKVEAIKATNEDEAMEKLIQMAAHYGYRITENEMDDLCLVLVVAEVRNETGREIELEKLKLLVNDASILQATRETQELNRVFYRQYLTLQQKMAEESQKFQRIGNVMKAKHDVAMNAIRNAR